MANPNSISACAPLYVGTAGRCRNTEPAANHATLHPVETGMANPDSISACAPGVLRLKALRAGASKHTNPELTKPIRLVTCLR